MNRIVTNYQVRRHTSEPGDLIVGGADGVMVAPKEHILQDLQEAEEKLTYEVKCEKL